METSLIDKHSGNSKVCDFCHAEEGKLRLIGSYIVVLKTVDVFGSQKKACQSCIHKQKEVIQSRKVIPTQENKNSLLVHLKKFTSALSHNT